MNGSSSSWYKHVIKNENVYSLTAQEYCTGAHMVKLIFRSTIRLLVWPSLNIRKRIRCLRTFFAKHFVQVFFLFCSWLDLLFADIQLIYCLALFYRPWAYTSALSNELWVWSSRGATSNWPEPPVWLWLPADCSPACRTYCVTCKILYYDLASLYESFMIQDTSILSPAFLPAYFKNNLIT